MADNCHRGEGRPGRRWKPGEGFWVLGCTLPTPHPPTGRMQDTGVIPITLVFKGIRRDISPVPINTREGLTPGIDTEIPNEPQPCALFPTRGSPMLLRMRIPRVTRGEMRSLSFFSVGLHLRHMDVPRPGVKSELHLLAYTTATTMPQPQPRQIQAASATHVTACGNAGSLTH